jgi:phosphoserine phosphatase
VQEQRELGLRLELPSEASFLATATSEQASPYHASPETALAAVAKHPGEVLVDLDETLYLRNSTEDFIDLARPGVVALLLLRLLELLRPWRWTGGELTRDVWRVQLVYRLFPWTMTLWKSRVAALAENFSNKPLLEILKARQTQAVIVTVGFLPIVRPLVAALGLPQVRIIGARINSVSDRQLGKLPAVLGALGQKALDGALVLTDALEDLPLLERCSVPLHTVWPGARYQPALARVYLPGQYISRIKRPGEHYFRRAVLQEDYAVWVLSSIALAPAPWYHVAGLFLLLCSFWIIYERGYVDNDLMAAKLEKEPTLSAAFYQSSVATPFWIPWLWSTVVGAAGVWVLRRQSSAIWVDWLRWEAVLVCTFLWFAWYNRVSKSRRIWMYSVLQFARAAAFTALVPILPIGAMALGAHVLARWSPYYLYRTHGEEWPRTAQEGLIRVLFFVVLAALFGIAAGWASVLNWTTLAVLVWSMFRARYDLLPKRGAGRDRRHVALAT